MPAERTTMRQVREVLRLKFVGGVPTREIARRIGVAPSTVHTTIRRLQAAGLSWPLPEELTDAALEARLAAQATSVTRMCRSATASWARQARSNCSTAPEESARSSSRRIGRPHPRSGPADRGALQESQSGN
jgi:transposase-like protein